MRVDLVSDLHENTWDGSMQCESMHPMKWEKGSSSILVVAGDVTDNINHTCDVLRNIDGCYRTVLFVEGNHDHADNYPELHLRSSWSRRKELNRCMMFMNIVYLPSAIYVERVSPLCACGWWDYNNQDLEHSMGLIQHYFDDWVGDVSNLRNCPEACVDFARTVKSRGTEEVAMLRERIQILENDARVRSIVVVTHTPPILDGIDSSLPTYMHSQIATILQHSSKVTHWLFGHTHNEVSVCGPNGVHFVSHPRGSRCGAGAGRASIDLERRKPSPSP